MKGNSKEIRTEYVFTLFIVYYSYVCICVLVYILKMSAPYKINISP